MSFKPGGEGTLWEASHRNFASASESIQLLLPVIPNFLEHWTFVNSQHFSQTTVHTLTVKILVENTV